jgi:hypothetical protein
MKTASDDLSAIRAAAEQEATRRDRAMREGVSCLVFGALLLAVFASLQQRAYWSDGRFMVEWLSNGRLMSRYVTLLPLGHVIHGTLGRLFQWPPEESLHFLSNLSGAAAGALVMRAGLAAGMQLLPSLGMSLLLMTTPVVWFYSTCIEAHASQLAAASAALCWSVTAWRKGRLVGPGLAPWLVAVALVATHLVGALWALAFLYLTFGLPPWRDATRRLPTALAILASVFAVLGWAYSTDVVASANIDNVVTLGSGPSVKLFVRELLRPGGGVYPWLAVVLVATLRYRPLALLSPPAMASLLVFGALVPCAFVVDVVERGAYFISLLPLAVFWIGHWVDSLAGPARKLACALLLATAGAQLYFATRQVAEWERAGSAPAWAEELEARFQSKLVLFTTSRQTANLAGRHSKMFFVAIGPGTAADLGDPQRVEQLWRFLTTQVRRGYRVGMLQDVLDSDADDVSAFRRSLEERLGGPAPFGDSPCLLFPETRH